MLLQGFENGEKIKTCKREMCEEDNIQSLVWIVKSVWKFCWNFHVKTFLFHHRRYFYFSYYFLLSPLLPSCIQLSVSYSWWNSVSRLFLMISYGTVFWNEASFRSLVSLIILAGLRISGPCFIKLFYEYYKTSNTIIIK